MIPYQVFARENNIQIYSFMNYNHVVDRDAAKYFYEVNDYYGSFEEEFNRSTAELGRLIQGRR